MKRVSTSLLLIVFCSSSLATIPLSVQAESTRSFPDISKQSPLGQAVEYLVEKGVLQGYPDGTFKPERKVNRAEAIKIIVAAKNVPGDQISALASSGYNDVPKTGWFFTFVEWAHQNLHIIDGPPKTVSFHPDRTVNEGEFLKMLFLSEGMDPKSYGDVTSALSSDTGDSSQWYYQYIRLALGTSVMQVNSDGTLSPGKELTRGDVAQFLYRLKMFKEGRRTQALLSEAESEILNIVALLSAKNVTQAEFASYRAILCIHGASKSKPDEPVVKAAEKIVFAFYSLVLGYRAGVDKKFADAITFAKSAWTSASGASQLNPETKSLELQVQSLAKKMADESRAEMARTQ